MALSSFKMEYIVREEEGETNSIGGKELEQVITAAIQSHFGDYWVQREWDEENESTIVGIDYRQMKEDELLCKKMLREEMIKAFNGEV
jgi:hypothetical protein